MAKTVQLDPDVHSLLMNARIKLFNNGINITIADMVGTIIKDNLDEFVTKLTTEE